MEIDIRAYEPQDFASCEELVNEAWHFDTIFSDRNLSTAALRMYTKGGLSSGNMNLAAVCRGKVIGFLFGYNLLSKRKPRGKIKLALEALVAFNFKKMDRVELQKFIQAITDHNKNRNAVEPGKASEICLFVVSKEFQGKKVGTQLWERFRDACMTSGVARIRVETNTHGASSYYEKQGFTLVGFFESPLHALATPGGQAGMYEYVCNKETQQILS